MLKSIKNILKTMGEALTFANAGEMLSGEQQTEVLARHKGAVPVAPDAMPLRVVLASGEDFSTEALERAIALCGEKKVMLDLLYVASADDSSILPLTKVLSRLEAETDLDFQITRIHGELLAVTDSYLRNQRDILIMIIGASEDLRNQVERYRRQRNAQFPDVKLIEDVLHA